MNLDFTYNLVLAALVLPLGVLFLSWFAKGRPVTLPLDHSRASKGRPLRFLLQLAGSLPALLLAVAIALLANPVQTGLPKKERKMNNVIFCVDVSGSMTNGIGNGKDRFHAAHDAMADFIEYRGGDSFGLTIFASEFSHWVPVTKDPKVIPNTRQFTHPDALPKWFGQGTKIRPAVEACQIELNKQKKGGKMIILISDGRSRGMDGSVPREMAQSLTEDGITLYAIHIGSPTPPGSIKALATNTGGAVFTATTEEALQSIFAEIDEMEAAEFKPNSPIPMDHPRPFALAGLSILGTYLLTLFGLRFTPW